MVFQTLITSVTDNIRQDIWRGQEDDRTARVTARKMPNNRVSDPFFYKVSL